LYTVLSLLFAILILFLLFPSRAASAHVPGLGIICVFDFRWKDFDYEDDAINSEEEEEGIDSNCDFRKLRDSCESSRRGSGGRLSGEKGGQKRPRRRGARGVAGASAKKRRVTPHPGVHRATKL